MKNPFEFGRELGTGELVDREDEVAEVIDNVRHGGKLFLIGPRRYGKTSILKVAEDRLLADGAIVLRYDAEGYPTLDRLVAAIMTGAARHMKGRVDRVGDEIRKFFAKLRPELSFSVSEREWSAKLGINVADSGMNSVALLAEALDGLEEMAKSQPRTRPIGLFIDEFQSIVASGGQTAEAHLRAGIQRHKHTAYVFAGSQTRLLTAMTMDASRPFYRLGQLRFIGSLPRAEFGDFLRSRFLQSKFTVQDPGVISLVLDLAEDVPYNVQMLAHACWDVLNATKSTQQRNLNEKVVRESLERLVRQYDPFYTQLWNGLTAIQQKTLRATIAESGVNLQSMKVVRMLGKGPSTVRRSLDAMIDRGILREEDNSGQVRMRFEDPFFSHWIRMFTATL